MNEALKIELSQLQREKRTNGLLYGLIAGVAFSLLAWGMDTLLLWQAHAAAPWMKLAMGGVFCLLVTVAAGLATSYTDNGGAALLIWLAAGLVMAWFFSYVPFNGVSTLIGLFRPELRGLDLYPFGQSAAARRGLLYVGLGGLFGLAGFLQLFLVDGAGRASSLSRRLFLLGLCVPVLAIAGLLADSLVHVPLRSPILAVDELIRLRRRAEQVPISQERARDLHLRALDSLAEWIDRPYRLVLGEYGVDTLGEATVAVNFDGHWGRCLVIEGQPTFCQKVSDLYLRGFNCLAVQGLSGDCRLQAGVGRESLLEKFQKVGLAGSSVLEQQGNVVLLAAATKNGSQYRCRARSKGDIILEACDPVPSGTFSPETLAAGMPILTPRAAGEEPLANTRTQSAAYPTPGEQKSNPATHTPAASKLPDILSTAPQYTIQLQVDYENQAYRGTSQVDYTNAEKVELDRLYFRLMPNAERSYGGGSLAIRQMELNGNGVKPVLSLHDTVLEVLLPSPLKPGETVQVGFEFEGIVPRDFGGPEDPSGYGTYNFSDGVLALSGFYPILAVYDEEGWNLDQVTGIGDPIYSDIAFYWVEVTANSDLVIAGTGSAQVQASQEPGKQHLRFEQVPAREFFLIMSPDFQVVSEKSGGMTVNSYYLLEHPAGGKRALAVAGKALDVFNEQLGAYPYKEFDVVEAPMFNALGVEFPGIVLVSSDLYDDPEASNLDVTVSHEVAHQWWYNLVGNDVYDEPWLDEGLTTYTSGLFFEFAQGKSAAEGLHLYWQERYDQLRQAGLDEPVARPIAFFEQGQNSRLYSGVVYLKGALFFHALRQEIGDEAFFTALQDYVTTYQYGIAQGVDLLGIFEEAAGKELDDLYQKWLFKE